MPRGGCEEAGGKMGDDIFNGGLLSEEDSAELMMQVYRDGTPHATGKSAD